MNSDCLPFCLNLEEHEFFQTQGYLIVRGALDKVALAGLLSIVDRIDANERTVENQNKLLSVTDVIAEDPMLVELIDWHTVFPKVWGILGWNIYLYHSHIDVTPPADDAALATRVAWHQDSMRVNDEIESHPRPRLSLKVGFYLTDVSQPDRGNTLIVPGSHLMDSIDCPADGVSSPAGAEPLCLQPGDALLLDRRTWHSRSPNLCEEARKVIWYGYSYRWMRPKDAMTVKQLYPSLDPIRRQILGDGLSANGVYDPVEGDVPLRSWLQEHAPTEAERSLHKQTQSRPPAMVRGKNLGRQ